MSDKEKIKEIISIIVNGTTRYTSYLSHQYFDINNRDFHRLLKLLDLKPARPPMPTRELDKALSRLINENSELFSVYGISSPPRTSPMYLDGFIRYEYETGKYA